MKRRRTEDSDEEDASGSESFDEEMSLDNEVDKMVQVLSKSIPKERVLNLLHSMAASKGILYWNPHGEMTYHKQRIPVTSMKELIEYAMLPYNPDIRPPRGLRTFTKGLVELGINKHLIQNQKLIVDLVATQPEDEDDESENESEVGSESTEEQSDDHEMDEEQEEVQSSDNEENPQEEERSTDEESNYDEQRECFVCQEPGQFLKISVIRCPTCHWHEGHIMTPLQQAVQCDICAHVFPSNLRNTKKNFYCCNRCNSIHQMSLNSGRLKLVVPSPQSQEMGEEANEGAELDHHPSLPFWTDY